MNINGDIGDLNSMSDYAKIVGYINSQGVMYAYCNSELKDEVSITFTYPLKSS
jgi:hypothetical protein